MERHLIVLDLDGTLLTDTKTISPTTKMTLQKAKDKGHQVMIATGRPFRASQMYYEELGLTTPIVNFNGAYVHHPRNPLWQDIHTPIDMRVVHDVVESIHKYDYKNLIAEVLDDVYIHLEDDAMLQSFNMGSPRVLLGDITKNLQQDPTSLLIYALENNIPAIRQHLQDVHAELIEHRSWGVPFPIVEIVRKGLSKAVGIHHIAQEMGIPRERIIAFGDEDNDLEMIEYAGIGVAMSNGITDLKNIANEITTSNNEDGIALFLADRLKL